MLARDELEILHLVLNTDCNAWDLAPTPDSPGVCRFCYRERNRVATDPVTIRRVLDIVRAESAARRVVFTGGDPLMPYDNHIEPALEHAKRLGFETNVHTNGLLLPGRYPQIAEWVDVYSLALDGADAATADWFRGEGYFEQFQRNIALLAGDRRRLAFNTFTSARSARSLPGLARLITDVAAATTVEYWLISQYRPIGRPNLAKQQIYGYPAADFTRAVDQVRPMVEAVPVFAQPTREPSDPYPFRIWVLGDGTVTADLGSVAAKRNEVLGNLLTDGFAALGRRAHTLRAESQELRS